MIRVDKEPSAVLAEIDPPRPGVFNIDNLIDEMLPEFLIRPSAARERIAARLGVPPSSIVALKTTRLTVPCDIEAIFSDPLGRRLVAEYRRFQGLLAGFDPSPMGSAYAELLTHNYVDVYFRNSMTRLYNLVEMLRSFGIHSGSILDVGSFYCYFAAPLQRLGYQVTAIDRYRQFGGALDGFLTDFRQSGGTVVETDEAHEVEELSRLGEFDAVISMATVEHIPHTPREFLEAIVSHVRQGGVLLLDTPNIARYFNRQYMSEGKSIHQPIEYQFRSTIPFEGHHREYTEWEVRWMLEQIGCKDIRTGLFDHNIFQSEIMTGNLIDIALKLMLDESLCDIILAAGRVN